MDQVVAMSGSTWSTAIFAFAKGFSVKALRKPGGTWGPSALSTTRVAMASTLVPGVGINVVKVVLCFDQGVAPETGPGSETTGECAFHSGAD